MLADNLHTERHLETTYYVTDVKQTTDFAWYRGGSGVRVNIKTRDINLVPAYDDVISDTGSDNAFVLTNPDTSPDDHAQFADIVRHHCRSVLSDLLLRLRCYGTTLLTAVGSIMVSDVCLSDCQYSCLFVCISR